MSLEFIHQEIEIHLLEEFLIIVKIVLRELLHLNQNQLERESLSSRPSLLKQSYQSEELHLRRQFSSLRKSLSSRRSLEMPILPREKSS